MHEIDKKEQLSTLLFGGLKLEFPTCCRELTIMGAHSIKPIVQSILLTNTALRKKLK